MSSSYRNRINKLLSHMTVGSRVNLAKRRSPQKRGGLFEFLETRQLLSVTPVDTLVGPLSHAVFNFANVTFQVSSGSGTLTDIEFTTLPPNGTLQLSNVAVNPGDDIPISQLPNLTYTPNASFGGADVGQWEGSDDAGSTFSVTPANLTLNVNNQPTLSAANLTITHDHPLTIPLSTFTGAFTDGDSDALSNVTFITLPSHASSFTFNGTPIVAGEVHTAAELSTGTLLYVPAAGYTGPDSFDWNASDGIENAAANATASITVVDNAPTLANNSIAGKPNLAIAVPLSSFQAAFTDADAGDTLHSVTFVTLPAHGTLKLGNANVTAGQTVTAASFANLTYTSDQDYVGADSFQWNASDSILSAANNSIDNITTADARPTLSTIAVSGRPNLAIPIQISQFNGAFTDTDIGDSLQSVTFVTLPTHGTLMLGNTAVTAGQTVAAASLSNLTYTSNQDYVGPDSFQWNASDGSLSAANSSLANITLADARPVLSNTIIHAPAGANTTLGSSNFPFSDSDTNDSLQQVVIKTLPAHGSLKLINNGAASDVTVNQALSPADLANLTYIPDASYTSSDAFTWNASDGSLSAASDATFTLTTDTAPVVNDIALLVLTNGSHTFSAKDFDPTGNGTGSNGYTDIDKQPLSSITITGLPTSGTLLFNGSPVVVNQTISAADLSQLVYTTTLNATGFDQFLWTASDGSLTAVNSANVGMAVLDPTQTTSGNLSVSAGENRSQPILGSAFAGQFGPAPSGVSLPLTKIEFVTLPAHGKLTVNNAAVTQNQTLSLSDITYTPDAGFTGSDSFTWAGSTDGTHFSATPGTVSLTVTGPTETVLTKFLPINTTSAFSATDFTSHFSAFNSAPLASIRITTLPTHGVLKLGGAAVKLNQVIAAANVSSLTYTPKAGYSGSESFSWAGSDGAAFGAPVAVNITLLPALSVTGRNLVVAQNAKPNVLNGTDFQSWTIAADPSMGADTRTFAIRNSTTSPMSFKNVASGGPNKNDFRIIQQPANFANGGFIIQPGDAAIFTVQFLPHGVGLRTGAILLRNAAGAIVYQFAVQGTSFATRSIQTTSLDSSSDQIQGVVQVATTKTGSGSIGVNGVIISMSYTGYLANGGTIFDATSRHGNVPLTFRLDDDFVDGQPFLTKDQANVNFGDGTTSLGSTFDTSVIAGWEYGLQGIKPGEHRTLIISGNAGYGENGSPDSNTGKFIVPPNSTLVFDVICTVVAPKPQVEQLELNPAEGGTADTFTLTAASGSSTLTHTFVFFNVATDNANGTPLASWKPTSNITLGGPHGADFSFTGPTQDASFPSAFDVTITFHPLTTGVKHENLSFTTNDPKNPKITLELVGSSSKYSDLSVGFDPGINLPITTVIAGSGQTVTVPVTVSNTGDSTFPNNSKTNIQIYATNTSNNAMTLVGYVNNINLSGLEVRGIKKFNAQIALPLDNQSPFGAFASGLYTFTAVVNKTTKLANSTVSGLVQMPPDGKFITMVQGAGDDVTANQTMTDNDTADTGTASIPSKKPVNRFINVVAGQYTLSGSLGASTVTATTSGAQGAMTLHLQNLGNIFTIPSQVLSINIIARPIDSTNGNLTSVTLVNNYSISPGRIGPGGSLNVNVPVNFSGAIAQTTYVLLARVELVDTGGNIIGGQQVLSLDQNLNPILLHV